MVFLTVGLGVLVQGASGASEGMELQLIADGLPGYGQECSLIQVLLHLVVIGQNVSPPSSSGFPAGALGA